uniref:Regulatory protein zeste n=1 Tax=Syphacia muris TaxID=451379 RepID=A0A0N5AHG4_9BILA
MLNTNGVSSVKSDVSDGEFEPILDTAFLTDSTAMVEVDGQNCDSVIREYDRLVLGIDSNSALRKTKFVLMGEMSDYLINEILDDADYLLVCDSKSTEANRRRADAWKALLNKFERKYPGCNITPDMARRHFHYHRKRIQGLIQAYDELQKKDSEETIEDPRTKFTLTEAAIYSYMACRTKNDSIFGAQASECFSEQISTATEAATSSTVLDDNCDGRERQPTMTPTFTLRLLEEVRKSRGILKCANNRGESRRRKRIEWQRISDELNGQFGTAYTVMQIYKKVENVKGKVKQKLEAMKSLRDDRLTTLENFTAPEQFFMENMMDGLDFESGSQMDDEGDEDQNRDLLTQIGFGSKLDASGTSVSRIKVENDESFLPANVFTMTSSVETSPSTSLKRVSSTTDPGCFSDTLADQARTKRIRLSPHESPTNGSPVPLNLLLPMAADMTFKEKLVNCLSQIPTERMQEIHRIVKREIDLAYAQQISDEILNRFDEAHREGVMNRILEVLKRS